MFSHLSWSEYLISSVVFGSVYFLWIAIRYYPQEIKAWLTGKSKPYPPLSQETAAEEEAGLSQPERDSRAVDAVKEIPFEQVEALIVKLGTCIQKAAARHSTLEDCLAELRQILLQHPDLRDSPFRIPITEWMVLEADKYEAFPCSFSVLMDLWEQESSALPPG